MQRETCRSQKRLPFGRTGRTEGQGFRVLGLGLVSPVWFGGVCITVPKHPWSDFVHEVFFGFRGEVQDRIGIEFRA